MSEKSTYSRSWWIVSNRQVESYRTLNKAKRAWVEHRLNYPTTPVTLLCREFTWMLPPHETVLMEYGGGSWTPLQKD